MVKRFVTKRGSEVALDCRIGTNDENVCVSVIAKDEYGLADLTVPGGMFVFDIGAYIGAFTIAAIADFNCRVVAVEPVEENAEQIRLNIEQNGMWRNAWLEPFAAGNASSSKIGVGYRGLNRYVGNVGEGRPEESRTTATFSLSHYVEKMREHTGIDRVSLMKVDCEGCEWDFLDDPSIRQVDVIVGELHGDGDIEALLGETHSVEMIGDYIFRAVRA